MRVKAILIAFMLTVLAVPNAAGATPAASPATSASPAVRDWNLYAVSALVNASNAPDMPGAGLTPTVAEVHLAIVQGAVYDAVNSIVGGYEPYLSLLPPTSPSASLDAAVGAAAYHVLIGLQRKDNQGNPMPLLSQVVRNWLDPTYTDFLAAIPAGDAKVNGIDTGMAVAQAMLDERADDGRWGTFRFTVGLGPGQWRPTDSVNDPFAWVAGVDPFLLDSASQVRTDGPNALTSDAYAEEFEEVKTLGSSNSTMRTPEQTAVARFFTDSPVRMWNRAFREIAEDKGLTIAEEARLFAVLNMAGADAHIGCWDDKAHWSFWRPVTAIHLADTDDNPATEPDSMWMPLITTPPYPDHPSGFTCISSGITHAAQDFFGTDRISFTLNHSTRNEVRDYDRLSWAVKDIIDARVWLGIHFRTADVQANVLGMKVARWLHRHYFRPVD